jgi:hypothetical protein
LAKISSVSLPESYRNLALPPSPAKPTREEDKTGQAECSETQSVTPPAVPALIASWLAYHGYSTTAHAFEHQLLAERRVYEATLTSASSSSSPMDFEPMGDDISTRERLKRAILEGRVDDAIEGVQTSYPALAEPDSAGDGGVLFRLRCHRFVEMVKSSVTKAAALDAALAYGRSLQEHYGANTSDEVQTTLRETFSLLAYAQPERQGGRVAYLVSQEARDELADRLNSAILGAFVACVEAKQVR